MIFARGELSYMFWLKLESFIKLSFEKLDSALDYLLFRFVGDDVSLFKGITSDIFPKTKKPEITRKVLQQAIEEACKKNKLQSSPWLVMKCLEFYEMIQVQHGIMIIGRQLVILKIFLNSKTHTNFNDMIFRHVKVHFGK